MREILFKAKRIGDDKWIEGYYVNQYNASQIYIPGGAVGEYCFDCYHIDKSTLCQFTGLCDKNGRKIWENDIVKYHFGDDVAPIRFGVYQSCFDSTQTGHVGFYVDWNEKISLRKDLGYWVNMIDCNVIGNVFDNPELLKEGAV